MVLLSTWPFALALEAPSLEAALLARPRDVLGFLALSSALAVGYNVALFQALRTLSSVGTSILGNIKIVLLMLATAITLGELREWSATALLGCATTLAASWVYAWLRL